jgi:digeranylgeranylglycerophospholipid reductase
LAKSVDIAVVGGSVSGGAAAYTAAGNDASVALFEEHRDLGYPNHCPGHISIAGLRRVGIKLPKQLLENEIWGGKFYSPKGYELKFTFPEPVFLVLNRVGLERYLVMEAGRKGAEINLGSRVVGVSKGYNGYRLLEVKRGSKSEVWDAKVVLDAEGYSSILSRQLGLPSPPMKMAVYGAHAIVEGVEDVEEGLVEVYYGNKVAPGFYAWIIPTKDGRAKIGLASNVGSTKRYMEYFMHQHPLASKKLKNCKIVYELYYPITLGGPIGRTFADGFMVIGNAASQVKPTTGGGIIFGMLAGRRAAEVAMKAVGEGNCLSENLAAYERLWRKELSFDLNAMLWIRRILNRLSDARLDRIFKVYLRMGGPNRYDGVGKVLFSDLQGRSVVQSLLRPRALPIILYSFVTSQ